MFIVLFICVNISDSGGRQHRPSDDYLRGLERSRWRWDLVSNIRPVLRLPALLQRSHLRKHLLRLRPRLGCHRQPVHPSSSRSLGGRLLLVCRRNDHLRRGLRYWCRHLFQLRRIFVEQHRHRLWFQEPNCRQVRNSNSTTRQPSTTITQLIY